MDLILAVLGAPLTRDLALGSIVTVVIVMILLGRLIPLTVHRERMADKDTQIATLMKAVEVKDGIINTQVETISGLTKGAETTNRLMESLRNQFERQPERGMNPQRQVEQ